MEHTFCISTLWRQIKDGYEIEAAWMTVRSSFHTEMTKRSVCLSIYIPKRGGLITYPGFILDLGHIVNV